MNVVMALQSIIHFGIWNQDESNGGRYTESIIKLKFVKLINIKYFKYIGIYIISDKLGIRDKETEQSID